MIFKKKKIDWKIQHLTSYIMELYGWDTVFACSNSKINERLTRNMQDMIVTFDYEDNGIKISGTFSPWQIG